MRTPLVIGGGVLGVYLLVTTVLGMFWSVTPDPVFEDQPPAQVTGAHTAGALIQVVDTLLEKPGGFLSNDIFPPGLWLDNMPNWEFGALVQARDLARVMRESFSRSQSQSREDVDLAEAEPRLHFNNNSWMFPASESEYKTALKHLRSYRDRLADSSEPNSQFFARADNLRYWLVTVESRLGNLSQRLSASVPQTRFNTDLANDANAEQSTDAPKEIDVTTDWLELDDVFYEARGSTWALILFLRAAEKDFANVLDNKNALVSLRQIIRELESTQQPIRSPMVLNGGGFGLFANHSLVMASYISRAHAALIDLRELLEKG